MILQACPLSAFAADEGGNGSPQKITIEYVDTEGNSIKDTETIYKDMGERFVTIDYPEIKNYQPANHNNSEIIQEIKGPETIKMIYEKVYTIKLSPKNRDGEFIGPTETHKVTGNFTNVEIPYPDVEGWEAIDDKDSMVLAEVNEDLNMDITYDKRIYTIHAEYVNEHGTKIAPDFNITRQYGESCNIPSPVVDHMKPPQENEYVPKVKENINRTYVYKPCYYVTVRPVDQKGRLIGDTERFSVFVGDFFGYSVPYIDGYVIIKENYSIEKVTEDQDLNVVYGIDKYPVTVHYVDQAGKEIADPATYTVDIWGRCNYECPETIGNYKIIGDTKRTSEQITDYTDLYVEYEQFQYDVKVIFSKDGEEFSTQNYTVKKGDTLTFEYPEVEGYEPPVADYKETTDPITEDITFIRDYTKKQYSVTVHYLDKNGNTLAPDYEGQVEYMGDIQIDNPKVKGYKADTDGISICDVIEDMEVSVVYTKIQDKDKDKDKDKHPNTGDDSLLMLFTALLLVSSGGTGYLAARRRKEQSGK